MSNSRIPSKWARWTAAPLVGLMIAAAPVSAPAAHADPVDDAFIAALHAAGVQFGDSEMAKSLAKGFCKQMKRSTKDAAWLISGLVMGGIPRQMTTTFAGEAAKAYCPDMLRSLT